MKVFVKCKNCRRDFYIGMDVGGTEVLKTITMGDNYLVCPFCMETRTYNTTDYFLQQQ